MTQTQLSEHARSMVTKISPEKDVSLVTTHIPRALTSLIPKPICYYNFNVGECSDLIFGVSLVDYATSRGLGETDIPKIVRICIQEIDERGLESEGIYRVRYSSFVPQLSLTQDSTGVGAPFRCTRCAPFVHPSRNQADAGIVATQDRKK